MKLSQFKFTLPDKLIAKYPPPNRQDARLMVAHRDTGLIDCYDNFDAIKNFFHKGDVLVLNDTKVFAGNLRARKEKPNPQGKNTAVDVTLTRELNAEKHLWEAIIDRAREIRTGNKLCFNNEMFAEVTENISSCARAIKFAFQGDSEQLKQIIQEMGNIPIAKALKRKPEPIDKIRYQTIYNDKLGSIAPPSAGFHFTKKLLKYLDLHDVILPRLTAHLGVKTFKLIDAEDLNKYKIHVEFYNIPESTADIVNHAKKKGQRICAVGTSTLKALESSRFHRDTLAAGSAHTYKFLHPGVEFVMANSLLTNFHLPRSIDFINTLAFAGHELGMEIYETAIEENFSFFIYGDALLIL